MRREIMFRILALLCIVAPTFALAQTAAAPPPPTEQEVINSYVKALEQQIAFKNQQAAYYEGKIRDWMEYSKPLWASPAPTAEAK
jgi:hypothetical protein